MMMKCGLTTLHVFLIGYHHSQCIIIIPSPDYITTSGTDDRPKQAQ